MYADLKYMVQDFAIPGFLSQVQEDVLTLVDYKRGLAPKKADFVKQEQYIAEKSKFETKVALAGIRTLTLSGMALGTAISLSAAFSIISSPFCALFGLAVGVSVYAANHDVFIVCVNTQKQIESIGEQIFAACKDFFNIFATIVGGKKRLTITQGTILRPTCDYILKLFVQKINEEQSTNAVSKA